MSTQRPELSLGPALARRRLTVVLALLTGIGLLASSASSAGSSPRESRIAFVRIAPTSGRLLILTGKLDGGPRRALRLPVPDAQGPAWSPNGRMIAFVGGQRAREGRYVATDADLYVARSDGRRARRVTRDVNREAAPAWSPDGTELVYVRSARVGNGSTLWVVGMDGAAPRQLTAGRIDLQPSWSPDGRRIVFVRISANYQSAIWEVRSDGTGLRRVLAGLTGVTQPTWSPDGTRLLLTDGQTLFTVRRDGGGRRVVARLSTDARGARVDPQPTWSRSGWIAFCQLRPGTLERSDVWRVRPDGSELRRVTQSPSLDSEPVISP
jgi:Tol biopolymer transport system component